MVRLKPVFGGLGLYAALVSTELLRTDSRSQSPPESCEATSSSSDCTFSADRLDFHYGIAAMVVETTCSIAEQVSCRYSSLVIVILALP